MVSTQTAMPPPAPPPPVSSPMNVQQVRIVLQFIKVALLAAKEKENIASVCIARHQCCPGTFKMFLTVPNDLTALTGYRDCPCKNCARTRSATNMLHLCQIDPDDIFDFPITADECWVYCCDFKTKILGEE